MTGIAFILITLLTALSWAHQSFLAGCCAGLLGFVFSKLVRDDGMGYRYDRPITLRDLQEFAVKDKELRDTDPLALSLYATEPFLTPITGMFRAHIDGHDVLFLEQQTTETAYEKQA